MGQRLVCPQMVLQPPAPMVPDVIGTWSYSTVSRRMVATLRVVLTTLGADGPDLATQIGAFGNETVETMQSDVEELLVGLCRNKYLTLMTGSAEDVPAWNQELEEQFVDGEPPRWHSGNWLYVECYLYRKLYDIFESNGIPYDYDCFFDQKISTFRSSEAVAEKLGVSLREDVEALPKMSEANRRECFKRFLMASLFGNECDLSLEAGLDVSMKESPLDRLDTLTKKIVVNEWERIYQYLKSRKTDKDKLRLDLVMDNAGLELFADLCFADVLITMGLVGKVIMHLKPIPWFVSDTTNADVDWLLNHMKDSMSGETLPSLAQRWQHHIKIGNWELTTSRFWTTPFRFDQMLEKNHYLYESLTRSTLILFKGDLNYRKLLGNRQWPVNTSFARGLNHFNPAPVAALRIMKADIVVGITQRRARRLSKENPDWMVCGKYALIQFCRHITPLDIV